MNILDKKIVVFDLDGTLAESKSAVDVEMASLLKELVAKKQIAIISGGMAAQFEKQLITIFDNDPAFLSRFFLFPTSGTRFLKYDTNGWQQVYIHEMSIEGRQKIRDAFHAVFEKINYQHPETVYGEVIEDRGTQVTFSAVGQQAPLAAKKEWRANHDRRVEMVEHLKQWLPEFEWKIPSLSSIDVTSKGIDKAYGITQMECHLGIPRTDMVFVGDGLYEGGNDYPVKAAGVDCVAVAGPEDTKALLRGWLQKLV